MMNKKECLAIGASFGGPKALKEILPAICSNIDIPIFITQHIVQKSAFAFGKALSAYIADYNLVLVTGREKVKKKNIYLYPGFGSMCVVKKGQDKYIDIFENGQLRYSIDSLLASAAHTYGSSAIAVVLTGMGCDGLKGAFLIKHHGGQVVVQDKDSSLVWSMPKAIADQGLADRVLSLSEIVQHIVIDPEYPIADLSL